MMKRQQAALMKRQQAALMKKLMKKKLLHSISTVALAIIK